jgi:hypothetical protein
MKRRKATVVKVRVGSRGIVTRRRRSRPPHQVVPRGRRQLLCCLLVVWWMILERYSRKDMYDHQVFYRIAVSQNPLFISRGHAKEPRKTRSWVGTYLGLIKWVMVKTTPRRIHMPPTTTYAIPRNGLRPPITVRVVRMIDLVPLYSAVGKSRYCIIRHSPFWPTMDETTTTNCE